MKTHLADEQISACVAGWANSEEQEHLAQCESCREQVSRASAGIALYRSYLRKRSDADTRSRSESVKLDGADRRWTTTRWAAAVAVLALVASVPVYRNLRRAPAQPAATDADTVLLEQVDAQVSQAVPDAMEPLARLMTWDGSAAGDSARALTTRKGSDEKQN